jgi:hypothetical protein
VPVRGLHRHSLAAACAVLQFAGFAPGELIVDDPEFAAFRVASLPNPKGVGIGFANDIFVAIGPDFGSSSAVVRVDRVTWNSSVFASFSFTGSVRQLVLDEAEIFDEDGLLVIDARGGCTGDDWLRRFDPYGIYIGSLSNGCRSTSIMAKGAGPVWSSLLLWGDTTDLTGGIKARDSAGEDLLVVQVPDGRLNGVSDVGAVVPPESAFAHGGRYTLVFTDEIAEPQVGLQRVNDLGVLSLVEGDVSEVGATQRGISYDAATDSILVVAALDGGIGRRVIRVSPDGSFETVAHVPANQTLGGMALGSGGRIYASLIDEGSLYALIPVGSLGDLDGDCLIGIADFLILLANWGPCPDKPDPCPADLDGDGVVAVTDFLLLLANWGPWP